MRKSIWSVLVLLFVTALAAGNSGQGVVHAGTDSATLNAMGSADPNLPAAAGVVVPATPARVAGRRVATWLSSSLYNFLVGRSAPPSDGYTGLHYSLFD